MSEPLLAVTGLTAGYGKGLVLHGVDLAVHRSQVVGLVGRNGMGKTTLMHTLVGMRRAISGQVLLDGCDVTRQPSHAIWNDGMALVPQGRRVFAGLTVAENFAVIKQRPGRWGMDDVYGLFPRLAERRRVYGGQLSGGEQQMLAIGRALLGNPQVLLLDEPCEGLAPAVVHEVGRVLSDLRDDGQSILLVEQNLDLVLTLSSDVAVMEKGIITAWSSNREGEADEALLRAAIGVGEALAN
jgi:branched-chain amino acid transport system ATP-binding protein